MTKAKYETSCPASAFFQLLHFIFYCAIQRIVVTRALQSMDPELVMSSQPVRLSISNATPAILWMAQTELHVKLTLRNGIEKSRPVDVSTFTILLVLRRKVRGGARNFPTGG